MNPYQPGPPMPGPTQMPLGPTIAVAPRRPVDMSRIASAVTAVAGIVVVFCSLLDLYSITVRPGEVDDSVTGTIDIGVGFYMVAPFNAPVIAVAVPLLMLVAALTALPGLVGRRDGSFVSVVSAIGATLVAIVLTMVDPLPTVKLSGELGREADEGLNDIGVSSVDQLVDRVVDTGPGAGLIIALVLGLVASAGAVVAYLRGPAAGGPAAFGPAPLSVPAPIGPPQPLPSTGTWQQQPPATGAWQPQPQDHQQTAFAPVPPTAPNGPSVPQ